MTLQSKSVPRYVWFVVVLLWPVVLLNYLDRQMLAAMKVSVMKDIPTIGLEQNWGLLLGAFKWVYAALSPIGGYIADRFSRRQVIAGSLFVWSVVTWATGHVTTYDQLLVARAFMGVSEAFYMPAALALIADFHPDPTRSRAIGLHQTGLYAGVIVGGFSGYVADNPDLGWRFAFSACGTFGIVYALPLLLLLKNPVRLADAEPARTSSPVAALQQLLTNRSFILLVLYFTLPALAGWVVRDWMPAILQKTFNISQGRAGRIFVSAIGMAMIVPAMFGVGNAGTLALAVAFLILFGLGWGFFDCNNMPILCQIVRPELRATGYGIMNLVSISCGGFADWGFGALRDHRVPLNVTFGLFASSAIVSIVLVLLIRPRKMETVV
jgi:MFS family permease